MGAAGAIAIGAAAGAAAGQMVSQSAATVGQAAAVGAAGQAADADADASRASRLPSLQSRSPPSWLLPRLAAAAVDSRASAAAGCGSDAAGACMVVGYFRLRSVTFDWLRLLSVTFGQFHTPRLGDASETPTGTGADAGAPPPPADRNSLRTDQRPNVIDDTCDAAPGTGTGDPVPLKEAPRTLTSALDLPNGLPRSEEKTPPTDREGTRERERAPHSLDSLACGHTQRHTHARTHSFSSFRSHR
jgi:hypothetical protein